MNIDYIINLIITTAFSIVSACIVARITTRMELRKNAKREKFDNYYARFHSIWDNIHRGCAYDFSDLSEENREKIIEFFIETDRYQDEKIRDLVYELKTSSLNNFDNQSEENIKVCNTSYNKLTDIIIDQYDKEIEEKGIYKIISGVKEKIKEKVK